MDLNKKRKIAKKAYYPYRQESLHYLAPVVLVITLILISFAFLYKSDIKIFPFAIPIIFIYVFIECIFNFRLSIFSLLEIKKCDWVEKKLTIKKISENNSLTTHYSFKSAVSTIYPPKMRVDRYNVICEDEKGKKVILKAVMSGKKYQVIQDRIFHSIPTTATILFGKHTKIIMYYKSADEWTDKLNHMF